MPHISINAVQFTVSNRGDMKKRYLYTLLFGVPGFFISGIVSLAFSGGVLGILWLFVFGDDPWPSSVETMTVILFIAAFLIIWIGIMTLGYRLGKKLEIDPTVNRNHVLISTSLTVLFILFFVLQQLSVGNLGPKSDSLVCGDFCTQQGYSGSGMPPRDSGDRTCSCFDDSGKEVITIPLDDIGK